MKISDAVMSVLWGVELDEGVLRLPGQLDRKLYLDTNKVLLALGATWNRKAGGHVFAGDLGDRLDVARLTGEVTTAKDLGYFPTPPELAERMVREAFERIPLGRAFAALKVLEPSAGDGAIVRALGSVPNLDILAVEIDQSRAAELLRLHHAKGLPVTTWIEDFLAMRAGAWGEFDAVVMNPPFARQQDIAHVQHALGFLRPGGVLVAIMAAGVQFRQDRRSVEFRALVERFGGTIEALPERTFRCAGTDVRTVLVTMQRPAGPATCNPT